METKIFYITTAGGKNYTGQSKEILNEQFGALEAGRHKVAIQKVGAYERPTRYRYYYAVVMTTILETCGQMFSYTSHLTGEQVHWTNTDEVHLYMKLRFNPETLQTPYGIFIVPGSTTKLSDTEFVSKFTPDIMAEFSASPFYCDFKDIDVWRAECKEKRESK